MDRRPRCQLENKRHRLIHPLAVQKYSNHRPESEDRSADCDHHSGPVSASQGPEVKPKEGRRSRAQTLWCELAHAPGRREPVHLLA